MDPVSDLAGTWRVAAADDDLRRAALDPDHDDGGWATIVVPGHWREHPAFAGHDGPLLYRRSFSVPAPAAGRRRWIVLDGLFYQADVWLDGAYLGDQEGYFAPHAFEVTELARLGDDHVLAVEVSCPPSSGRHRVITGAFQSDSGPAARWNPGGIWGPVRVADTGPVRVDRFRVLCRDADASRAHLLLDASLDAAERCRVVVRTSVDGNVVEETERSLAAGVNAVDWSLDIDEPRLWWPRTLGDQELTEITIEVLVDDRVSDCAVRRTGLREVAWNRWVCSVNGERLFLKGADLLPVRLAHGDVTGAAAERAVRTAADAGLDLLRIHGHIARPEVYDAADELGVLLIQDFPLSGRHARSVRQQAVEQAAGAVDLLGHHPSIAMWIAHDDPAGRHDDLTGRSRGALRRTLGEQLPSWNRTVLDRWVKRAIERADPTRPCVPHSGVLPHLPQLDGTDSHLSLGWRTGEFTDLGRIARRVPRLVRFVSEFGAQSVPATSLEIDGSRWPELDVERLRAELGAEVDLLLTRVPPTDHPSFDSWRRATQAYQAELVRHHIETLRRLKYRPAGGFCVFSLNDPAPAVSYSLIDHELVPKPAFDAMVAACAPVIVVADRPPDSVASGARLDLAVHVVNDRRTPVAPAVVHATATWPGGVRRWSFAGDVPADDCIRAGRMRFDVPDTSGPVAFDLRLTAGDLTVGNRYTTTVLAPPA